MTEIIGSFPVVLTNGTTGDANQVMLDLYYIQQQVNLNALPKSIFPGNILDVANGGTGGASHTANAVLVGDGPDAIQSTPVLIDPTTGAIEGFRTTFSEKSMSYTLQETDTGKSFVFTNGSGVNFSLPDDMPAGVYFEVLQMGAGAVGFVATGGATLVNRQTHTDTAGQYAAVSVRVTSNSDGSSAIYLLAGDTA